MYAIDVIQEVKRHASKKRADVLSRFFKTGPGQYGEGDIFLGLTVPVSRDIAKKYTSLPLEEIQKLLADDIHEVRLIGLLILVEKYEKAKDKDEKLKIAQFYMMNRSQVNNWDLVDLSAPKILGEFVFEYPSQKRMLDAFVSSRILWEKRIAIVATYAFIRRGKFDETVRIAELLMSDKHDLIHKAVGWMLREVGKRDERVLEDFLKKHHKKMPRTMLRYALERLSNEKKKKYMAR